LTVIVTFSEGHPFFAPEVSSDQLIYERHQDPRGKNFCLLENSGNDWRPEDSGAKLVDESLRRLLADVEAGRAAVFAGEADMPEPVSAQLPYALDQLVLVGDPFFERKLSATSGTLVLRQGSGDRQLLLESASDIGRLDPRLVSRLAARTRRVTDGWWVALDAPPRPEWDVAQLLAAINAVDEAAYNRLQRSRGAGGSKRKQRTKTVVVGLTFLEEGPSRGQTRRNWAFAEIKQQGSAPTLTLWRAQALTKAERQRRLPELRGLDQAHVVVIGAGSLGSAVAVELAKAGLGKIELFDLDIYDVNNAVRHVLPIEYAGCSKAQAVAEQCLRLNPFIEVTAHDGFIGDSRQTNETLAEALDGARVVVDTTGSKSVARYVERMTRPPGASLIVGGLTASSHGADVLTIRPQGACFDCFTSAQEDGLIRRPDAGTVSNVTPIGCSHPAFTGAGFEATELAAVMARRAIQETGASSYPADGDNWIVLNFRRDPHYESGTLPPQAGCKAHT
jgi:molybdopterin/thiamine biosynthesis adenylyltransferase